MYVCVSERGCVCVRVCVCVCVCVPVCDCKYTHEIDMHTSECESGYV